MWEAALACNSTKVTDTSVWFEQAPAPSKSQHTASGAMSTGIAAGTPQIGAFSNAAYMKYPL